jgi:hypothetical protein
MCGRVNDHLIGLNGVCLKIIVPIKNDEFILWIVKYIYLIITSFNIVWNVLNWFNFLKINNFFYVF